MKYSYKNISKKQKIAAGIVILVVVIAATAVLAAKKKDEDVKLSGNASERVANNKAESDGSDAKVKTLPQVTTEMSGVKVRYPERWSASNKTSPSAPDQQTLVFEAPGTATEPDVFGGEVIKEGARVSLFKNASPKTKNLDEFKQGTSFIWKWARDKQDTTISDVPAVEFNVFYEGPGSHYAVFYKNSIEYTVVIGTDAYDKPEYKADYENIVKNIEFTE